MKAYVVEWYGSGNTSEFFADSEFDAIDKALAIVGDNAVEAFEWEPDGFNNDGIPCKKILLWDDPRKAENDPGVHAVAKLVTTGKPR